MNCRFQQRIWLELTKNRTGRLGSSDWVRHKHPTSEAIHAPVDGLIAAPSIC